MKNRDVMRIVYETDLYYIKEDMQKLVDFLDNSDKVSFLYDYEHERIELVISTIVETDNE